MEKCSLVLFALYSSHKCDGENARSIVVLDNCSIHHMQHVIDLFVAAGILVLFLPPYSPDYMPIEETFSYVKYY